MNRTSQKSTVFAGTPLTGTHIGQRSGVANRGSKRRQVGVHQVEGRGDCVEALAVRFQVVYRKMLDFCDGLQIAILVALLNTLDDLSTKGSGEYRVLRSGLVAPAPLSECYVCNKCNKLFRAILLTREARPTRTHPWVAQDIHHG